MVVVDLDLECILLPCIPLYVRVILHGKICKARKGEGEKRHLKKDAILTGVSF